MTRETFEKIKNFLQIILFAAAIPAAAYGTYTFLTEKPEIDLSEKGLIQKANALGMELKKGGGCLTGDCHNEISTQNYRDSIYFGEFANGFKFGRGITVYNGANGRYFQVGEYRYDKFTCGDLVFLNSNTERINTKCPPKDLVNE